MPVLPRPPRTVAPVRKSIADDPVLRSADHPARCVLELVEVRRGAGRYAVASRGGIVPLPPLAVHIERHFVRGIDDLVELHRERVLVEHGAAGPEYRLVVEEAIE